MKLMNSAAAADPCHRPGSATHHFRDSLPILAPITVLVRSVDRVFWCCFSPLFVRMQAHCFPLRTMRVGRFDALLLVLLVSFYLHSAINKQKEAFQSNLSGVIHEKTLCEGFPLGIDTNEFNHQIPKSQKTTIAMAALMSLYTPPSLNL